MANPFKESPLSLEEAVETLEKIADLDLDHGVAFTEDHEISFKNEKIFYKTIRWLDSNHPEQAIALIKEVFKVILKHLYCFYEKEEDPGSDPRKMEGIKSIMVLVGEAAKKLDRYTAIFYSKREKPISHLKEYRKLQEFYLKRIAKRVDESVLSRWILGLAFPSYRSQEIPEYVEKSKLQHLYVDMEAIKSDTDYELIFIRRNDGTRFYNPKLIRNIQLVCDFGNHASDEDKGEDPLQNIKVWRDRICQSISKSVITYAHEELTAFYSLMKVHKEHELAKIVAKAVMALFLGESSKHLLENHSPKTCGEYFTDFQRFLREALNHDQYQKLIAYPPSHPFEKQILKTIHSLCRGVYEQKGGDESFLSSLKSLLIEANLLKSTEHEEAVKDTNLLWSRLACDYTALAKLMKRHPNGPLFKILESLENHPEELLYDPLMQKNFPGQTFNFNQNGIITKVLRIPAPVKQEFIDKASIIEEFKGFLRAFTPVELHLMVNLQNRVSPASQARAAALEELQNNEEFKDSYMAISLPVDGDFYEQKGAFEKLNGAEKFMHAFKRHIMEEEGEFYFPESLKNPLFTTYIDETFTTIHKKFFSNKNVLTKEQRHSFIQIFYIYLILQLIEKLTPTSISFTCKDGLDTGVTYESLLYSYFSLLNQSNTGKEREDLSLILFAPVLLNRERLPLKEPFLRTINTLKALEVNF